MWGELHNIYSLSRDVTYSKNGYLYGNIIKCYNIESRGIVMPVCVCMCVRDSVRDSREFRLALNTVWPNHSLLALPDNKLKSDIDENNLNNEAKLSVNQ